LNLVYQMYDTRNSLQQVSVRLKKRKVDCKTVFGLCYYQTMSNDNRQIDKDNLL
jgi:hypothetical protein